MIIIVGQNEISLKLRDAARAADVDCEVLETAEQASGDYDLVILNTTGDEDVRRNEVAVLLKNTTAPLAVRVRLEYVCGYARDMEEKNRIVGIRTMENEFIGRYVELIRPFDTDDDTYNNARKALAAFNEHIAEVPDIRGGIFYRMMPLTPNMGACLITEGILTEDVDKSMRYGANIKRPPLQMADELGLDLLLETLTDIYTETGRPAYRPSPLLKQMVNAGRLGKKSGRGFYEY